MSHPHRHVRALGRAAALAAALALAAGCTSTALLGAGAVEASGPAGPGPQRFAVVGFDLERTPERALPVFCVRLGDGEPPRRTDQLTLADAQRALPRWQPPPSVGDGFTREFPAHDVRTHDVFFGRGHFVSFRDGRLVALTVSDAESAAAALPAGGPPEGGSVGPASCAKLHALPIDRAEFVEVFGEPDRDDVVTDY